MYKNLCTLQPCNINCNHLGSTVPSNTDSFWMCFLREPEDDVIKDETCRPENVLFLLYIK
jgi:hypothetical protein